MGWRVCGKDCEFSFQLHLYAAITFGTLSLMVIKRKGEPGWLSFQKDSIGKDYSTEDTLKPSSRTFFTIPFSPRRFMAVRACASESKGPTSTL